MPRPKGVPKLFLDSSTTITTSDPSSSLLDGFFFFDSDLPSDPTTTSNYTSTQTRPSLSASILRDLTNPSTDPFKSTLSNSVTKLPSPTLRTLVASLHDAGHNVGLCESQWDPSPGITAGSYKYVDVIKPTGERYVIDIEFRAEFEIARPTEEYRKVLEALPEVFVGKAEELRKVVRIVAEEAKRSMRARDMHVPPWRKVGYVMAKWFGGYKRCVSCGGSAAQVSDGRVGTHVGPKGMVTCRAVGFDAGGFVAPKVRRIR